jgi:hypothetical protein
MKIYLWFSDGWKLVDIDDILSVYNKVRVKAYSNVQIVDFK